MTWKHAYLIPFLNDDSKIIFISNFSEIPERYAEKMPCVYVNEIEGDFENSIDVDLESYTEKLYVQRLTPVHYHNIHMINHK